MRTYIKIRTDGTIETFHGDFPIIGTVKRVSHIVPKNVFLRAVFKVLRKIFGDYGAIAEWTRRWNIVWLLIIGDKKWTFTDRKRAIEFERLYITNHKITKR